MKSTQSYSILTRYVAYLLLCNLFLISLGSFGILISDAETECLMMVLSEEAESDSEIDDDLKTDVFFEESQHDQISNVASHLRYGGPLCLLGTFCTEVIIPPPDSLF